MEKVRLTANILFSGIGCQERGFMNSNVFDIGIINTSEIDKDAILSYSAIHNHLTDEMVHCFAGYPDAGEMVKELTDKNIGFNVKEKKPYNWNKYKKTKLMELKKYWLACFLNKNLGDISKIPKLSYADLWTVSFPCQSISLAGKMKGFKPDSGTRSSLLWENIRLLKQACDDGIQPKYIMFENVKGLVSKRFIHDFYNLLDILSDLGYNTYWDVLNAKECGIPQNRERVFVICIRNDIDTFKFAFPEPFYCEHLMDEFLDEDVDEKYYKSGDMVDKEIQKLIDKGKLPPLEDDEIYSVRTLSGIECYRLMGFYTEDAETCIKAGVSETALKRQAGNGIVTNCVSLIAEHLYKAQYNNSFMCTDERKRIQQGLN